MQFQNRTEAGQLLAQALQPFKGGEVVVYGLPRGGVVLAAEVAEYLEAPMDLVIPRKIGHPYDPEYAVGAVSESGHLVCDRFQSGQLDLEWLKLAAKRELAESKRRRYSYSEGRESPSVAGKTAIIVDDGIATGLTAFAAIMDIQEQGPRSIILAVPVMPADTIEVLSKYADHVVALEIPLRFKGAIGAYYDSFNQVEDAEVISLLDRAGTKTHANRLP